MSFNSHRSLILALALLPLGGSAQQAARAPKKATATTAAVWLTTPDKSALFQLQPVKPAFSAKAKANPTTIVVDDKQTFQTIDGFGYCLTGGSAQLLRQMAPAERAKLLRELFGTDGTAIGVSYLRLSIGASDLDAQVFSYDDLPAGQTDPELAKFSLAPDQADLIPVL